MKTFWVAMGSAVLAAITSTIVSAATVIVTNGPNQFSDAGELVAVTSQNFASGYAPVAQADGGFETFAADSTLPVTYNEPYNYVLSQSDVAGSPLTQGAALLYYDFSQGDLPGWNYGGTAYDLGQDAGLLQTAIWALQGYSNPGSQYPSGTVSNPFYTYALTADPNALAANDDLYDVSIMQLSGNNVGPAQNLLVAETVPDATSTWYALAGSFGLLLLARKSARGQLRSPSVSRL